ncbi:hypothetical protein BOTBODRAFT_406370 [Botryobasidium botryosum FD-172 SS1]|uniref:Uncharacterized protein n=1 Tax=Botryobasidium botryosum (strain FD-172 SS1) TaxID=930990 RepID=A0A067MM56_BOTB1|nr:hypothetical protein BOTBODRAFT_406370 [Botryobasidium botryosum FD-172 SS1]
MCRGLTIVTFVVFFVFYLEQALFVETYREGAAHATQTNYGALVGESAPNITSLFVAIAFQANLLLPGVDPLSVVNVTAVWTQEYPLPEHPFCELKRDTTFDLRDRITLTAICPVIDDYVHGGPIQCDGSSPYDPCWPDMIITFDYSVLGTSAGTKGPSSATVGLGFGTEMPVDIMGTYPPVTLLNNLHLTASYTMNIRRTFNNNVQSFLGIFQAYRTFGVADIVIYGDNLDPSTPHKSNTSSLLLFQLYDTSAVRIVQDISANSFLRGLSNVGGLYTTANATFLFVFGFGLVKLLSLDRFSLFRGMKRHDKSTEQGAEKQE